MIRGLEGREIFSDDTDREDFISRTGKLVHETGTRIIAWALMDNHAHLLFFSGHQGISKFMRCLLTGYAIRYNRKYHRTGHLFQNRYKSIICQEDSYLLELVRYIHLNPLRANRVKNIEELDGYLWSGHSVLVGFLRNDWQERAYVLKQFSEDERRAIQLYRDFMKAGEEQGKRLDLVGGGLIRSLGGWSQVSSLRGKKAKSAHDARILGDGDFVTEILRETDSKVRRQIPSIQLAELMDQYIKETCKENGISEQELRMGGRKRRVSSARAKIAYHLSCEFGVSAAEIARQLGVCTSAIVKAIQNVESKNQ